MAVTVRVKNKNSSITKLGTFKAGDTNAEKICELVTLTEIMIDSEVPIWRGKILQDKTAEIVAKKIWRLSSSAAAPG